ncbi:MAG: phosphohistidine phosphatase SixA [Phormidesmis sp.]
MTTTDAYFIRHGIAVDRNGERADEARFLTPKGIAKTQQVAQRLLDQGLQFDTLLTSPLVRAQQTAEILHSAGLSAQIEEFLPLSPDGELSDWLLWLEKWQLARPDEHSMALVGHEPDLSQWAQRLVTGSNSPPQSRSWILKKAGVIGLQVPAASHAIGRSQLFWLSPPRFLS